MSTPVNHYKTATHALNRDEIALSVLPQVISTKSLCHPSKFSGVNESISDQIKSIVKIAYAIADEMLKASTRTTV